MKENKLKKGKKAKIYLKEAIGELERITGKKIPMPPLLSLPERSSLICDFTGSYDPVEKTIHYNIGLKDERLKKTIYHETLHHAANILCKDLYKLPDKEIYPYAFSLWNRLVAHEPPTLKVNAIDEGMAEFFKAAYPTKDKDEFPGNMLFQFKIEDLLRTDKAGDAILREIKETRYNLIKIYVLLSRLNGSFTPKDEEYDKDLLWIEIDKELHYIGTLIVLLLWEKYKLDNKTTDDLIKDVFASPHEVVDNFVKEIKNDNGLILKNALFDLSTSMETCIFKKLITSADGTSGLKEKIHKEMEKFKDPVEIEKSIKEANQKINETELLIASEKGDVEKVKKLIEEGVDVNIRDKYGRTPLWIAIDWKHVETAELLIANGADVDARDKYGWTPLMKATENNDMKSVELLIANGADVNARGEYGWTSLRIAIHWKYVEIAELLIANGADVNTRDENGWTPLMEAVENGDVKSVKLLIAHGADVNAKNNDGRTALDIAYIKLKNAEFFGATESYNRYQECIKVIKEAMEKRTKDSFPAGIRTEKEKLKL